MWGATQKQLTSQTPPSFQSTHPCGVRRCSIARAVAKSCFNPRTRVGCDTISNSTSPFFLFQSTHPCGVRLAYDRIDPFGNYRFNPRTRVGCDTSGADVLNFLLFQSTHPCGVRRSFSNLTCKPRGFQSTHPCGVRQLGFIV